MIYGKAEDIADKYIVGYKEEKERKKAEKARGRPPTWDETVSRCFGVFESVYVLLERDCVCGSLVVYICIWVCCPYFFPYPNTT
jgi:hypothetical protein